MIGSQKQFINIEPLVTNAVKSLLKLDAIFCNSSTCQKRELIGSMYPEKFTFEELEARTAKASEFYNYIYLINRQLESKKQRASDKNLCLPSLAPEAGLEPATL